MAENIYFIESDNLICAICQGCWLKRDSRELPCQHTFCFECLQKFRNASQNFCCPVCRKRTHMFDTKPNSIKKHFSEPERKKEKKVKIKKRKI